MLDSLVRFMEYLFSWYLPVGIFPKMVGFRLPGGAMIIRHPYTLDLRDEKHVFSECLNDY